MGIGGSDSYPTVIGGSDSYAMVIGGSDSYAMVIGGCRYQSPTHIVLVLKMLNG